jgi:hypothetical protein
MRSSHAFIVGAVAGIAMLCAAVTPADAKCTKLGFSVNDYGKEGPTRDAKNLLDKYVADWAKEKGIKGYKIGKKDVSCELFLNLIVVDEHTCKAEALVCWPDAGNPVLPTPTAAPAAKPAPPAAKPAPKPKAAAAG